MHIVHNRGNVTLHLRGVKISGGGCIPTRILTSVTCKEYNQELSTAHWPGCAGKGRLIQAGIVNVCKPVEERMLLLMEVVVWNESGEILI
jgi:hypothetical protein